MPANTQETLDIDNIFGPVNSDDLEANRRITVRYVRGDIKASLSNVIIFFSCAPLQIQLLDLSTKGALISSDRKIHKNKKLTLILEFKDGRTFEIKARIVRLDAFRMQRRHKCLLQRVFRYQKVCIACLLAYCSGDLDLLFLILDINLLVHTCVRHDKDPESH
jgi:hypothetical protein